ncbi:oxidoreductase [Rhodococcus sp. 06-412-2C]|uniref:PDR/VanB family oxidoreductase n=1 Tax=unclassified Rhodococcus (in: high G+C Gram-positive bacteria) TaxID=192944 RepID=UPI000B9AB87D|nr:MULTISPECIES: PDR/VanB family oxidoreductase [unclassified Rhodococcus (in: high G+C Gram-positive bacteria)]OZC83968.1 oxidoreductase [Rhodococcus sp. 06-412-2C]OZC94155.1 oxidoreductase [Rhodococcus sp. 06-412-2B]
MTDNKISWQRGTILSVEPAGERIAKIVVGTERAHRVTPGSHVDVEIDTGEVRSYSIVSSASDGKSITLGVHLSPTSRGGSRFMHTLMPGDKLTVTAPLQNFPLRIGAPRYVLLAGGIGITAMAAMAAALRRVGAEYRFHYVGRSRAAMAFLSELAAAHGDRLVLHVDDEGTGLDVDALVADIDHTVELYMCGPIRLMDAVRRTWLSRDLPLPNLRYETFGNSGWFEAQQFTVTIPRLGIETTVHEGDSLLDALERAGADMMFDCKKGECGLCQVDILDVQGVVDHRDVFFSENQKSTCRKLCSCVSRVAGSGGPATLTLDIP